MNRETFVTLNKTRLFTADQVVDIVQSERDTISKELALELCMDARKDAREKVLNRAEQLEKDMKAAFSRKTGEYNPTSIMLVQQYVKELRRAGEP